MPALSIERGGSPGPPWYGIDDATMRDLDMHEARAHALGGCVVRDLGDCILLHAPNDPEPVFNRVAAIRWPEPPNAFDHRLAEIIVLFAGLGRRPHVWTAPGFNAPADLARRLAGHGFSDMGGGFFMLLVRPPSDAPERFPSGVTIERLRGGPGVTIRDAMVRDISLVLAEAFVVEPDRRAAIEAETVEAFASPAFHVCLVRVGGEPVAVGKRYTFDGGSYLSSIGTRPGRQGRGYGSLVTEALVRDAIAAGSRYVYLGVRTHNDRAIALYRRAGLEILGERTLDFLMT